ncbi:MAG: hypothetical protein IPL75_13805 [Acidobacteria bacterium]|nr:hypothetical protein [Acidobacteriota bacterium]
MVRRCWLPLLLAAAVVAVAPVRTAQPVKAARISEGVQPIKTYGFSEPNPVPILVKDTRLYPYHAFEGYEHEGTPRGVEGRDA